MTCQVKLASVNICARFDKVPDVSSLRAARLKDSSTGAWNDLVNPIRQKLKLFPANLWEIHTKSIHIQAV